MMYRHPPSCLVVKKDSKTKIWPAPCVSMTVHDLYLYLRIRTRQARFRVVRFIGAQHQVLFAWVLGGPIDGRALIGVRLDISNMRIRRASRCILQTVDPYQQSSILHSSTLPGDLVVPIRGEKHRPRQHALLHSHTDRVSTVFIHSPWYLWTPAARGVFHIPRSYVPVACRHVVRFLGCIDIHADFNFSTAGRPFVFFCCTTTSSGRCCLTSSHVRTPPKGNLVMTARSPAVHTSSSRAAASNCY